VRIIAATNRELETMVEDGEFRLDLFHRLNDYRIDLPPLRDRGDDIVLLIEHILARLRKLLGKPVQGVTPEAMQLLRGYPWPGNVRELQSVLKKAVLRSTGPALAPETLPQSVRSGKNVRTDAPSDDGEPSPHDLARFVDDRRREESTDLYAETLEMMERYLIARVLRETGGNQSKAAQQLGITRGSLRHKIRTLGITIGHVVATEET
jgi:two-component system nitrogen regulation response regulator GlnG